MFLKNDSRHVQLAGRLCDDIGKVAVSTQDAGTMVEDQVHEDRPSVEELLGEYARRGGSDA